MNVERLKKVYLDLNKITMEQRTCLLKHLDSTGIYVFKDSIRTSTSYRFLYYKYFERDGYRPFKKLPYFVCMRSLQAHYDNTLKEVDFTTFISLLSNDNRKYKNLNFTVI